MHEQQTSTAKTPVSAHTPLPVRLNQTLRTMLPSKATMDMSATGRADETAAPWESRLERWVRATKQIGMNEGLEDQSLSGWAADAFKSWDLRLRYNWDKIAAKQRALVLQRSFCSWQQGAALHRKQLGLLDKAARRMMAAKMAARWSRWRATAEELRRQKEVMRRALFRLQQGKLGVAFSAWYLSATWDLAMQLTEMERQQCTLTAALNRMLNRAMGDAWGKWQQVYADEKFANRAGGGAIKRMLNRKLSMAFEAWVRQAQVLNEESLLLATLLWTAQAIDRAWNRWRLHALESRKPDAEVGELFDLNEDLSHSNLNVANLELKEQLLALTQLMRTPIRDIQYKI